MIIKKQYKKMELYDFLSLVFGILGITTGILSVIALSWLQKPDLASFIFTVICLIVDTLSLFMAMLAFSTSKNIRYMKIVKEMVVHNREKLAGLFDLISLLIGGIGITLAWASLITLFDILKNETVSIICTIIAVGFDVFSSIAILLAIIIMAVLADDYKWKVRKTRIKKPKKVKIKDNSKLSRRAAKIEQKNLQIVKREYQKAYAIMHKLRNEVRKTDPNFKIPKKIKPSKKIKKTNVIKVTKPVTEK